MLHLWQTNANLVESATAIRVLTLSLAGTLILHSLLGALLRQAPKASIGTSLFVACFFGAGHVQRIFSEAPPFQPLVENQWLGPAITFSTGAGLFALFTKALNTDVSNRLLFAFGLCISLVQVALLVEYFWLIEPTRGKRLYFTQTPTDFGPRPKTLTEETTENPDIYYIILDAYGRNDVLSEHFNYDNQTFTDQLIKRGFVVSQKSTSNYPTTFLSLASTLNMRLLNVEAEQIGARTNDYTQFYSLIQDNVVGRFLQSKGYQYVSAATHWGGTEKSEIADHFFRLDPPLLSSEFATILFNNTAAQPFAPSIHDRHHFAFQSLKQGPQIKGPAFFLSHVLIPHPPYVFTEDGQQKHAISKFRSPHTEGREEERTPYIEQLQYTNRLLLDAIDSILSRSEVQPIIIIQSDHGPDISAQPAPLFPLNATGEKFLRERHSILNAALLPPSLKQHWREDLTSINTFRLLFSELFGAPYPLLEPQNFFTWYGSRLELKEVTDAVRSDNLGL